MHVKGRKHTLVFRESIIKLMQNIPTASVQKKQHKLLHNHKTCVKKKTYWGQHTKQNTRKTQMPLNETESGDSGHSWRRSFIQLNRHVLENAQFDQRWESLQRWSVSDIWYDIWNDGLIGFCSLLQNTKNNTLYVDNKHQNTLHNQV